MTRPVFNEDTLSEKPAIERLKKLGYEYVHGDEMGLANAWADT